jgi:hypothetical protein
VPLVRLLVHCLRCSWCLVVVHSDSVVMAESCVVDAVWLGAPAAGHGDLDGCPGNCTINLVMHRRGGRRFEFTSRAHIWQAHLGRAL